MEHSDFLLAEILNAPRAVQTDLMVRMFDVLTSEQKIALQDYMKRSECISDNCKNQGIIAGTYCLDCVHKSQTGKY